MTDRPTQPPGWYYAEGDPAGTHRYWDGVQWQGGPQPVAAGGAVGMDPDQNAGPGPRFVAALIDAAIGWGIVIAVGILAAIFGAMSDTLGGIMVLVGYLAQFGYYIYNYIYLQGTTGQTIGKKQQGTKLVRNGEPTGMGMAFVRYLVIGVFSIPCGLDYWWILIDANNRRLSDRVLDMNVFKV